MSLANHVVVNLTIGGAGTPSAGFGTPLFLTESAVGATRLLGPFSTPADWVTAGGLITDAAYLWATKLKAQQPSPSQFFIGKLLAAEDTLIEGLALVHAEGPGSYYGLEAESRDPDDAVAIAAFAEANTKFALLQTSNAATLADTASASQISTVTIGGTPTDGTYTIEVIDKWTGVLVETQDVVRATTPATNDDIAAAFITAFTGNDLDDIAGIGGSGADVVVTFIAGQEGHGYLFNLIAPSPGTSVEVITGLVQNTGELLANANYMNTALVYHITDGAFLDGAWSGKGFAFNLDTRKGFWSYKSPNGITGDTLTTANKAALLANNVNYHAPLTMTSGVQVDSFTFPGKVAGGRQINQQTSIHWMQARLEEALLNVFLNHPDGVGFDDIGFALFEAAGNQVFDQGLNAGHLVSRVSATTGRTTPWIDVVPLAEVTPANDTAANVVMSGEFHIRKGALKVTFDVVGNLGA